MQTPPHSAPRVYIILPPDTTNNTEINTDKPIAHRTRASRTTPATATQQTHEPIFRRTRSKINPKELAQQVNIISRQSYQRRFPHAFIHNWAMPLMDKFTRKTLEHLQLRSHPKYKNTWNQSNMLAPVCLDQISQICSVFCSSGTSNLS